MNQFALEFFKIVEEMINSGFTCSEILKKINEQPYEIKSLFERNHLRTLKLGGDKVLKDQFNKGELVGSIEGRDLGETIKVGATFKLNDFDRLEIFIKESIKKSKKKDQEIKKTDKNIQNQLDQ